MNIVLDYLIKNYMVRKGNDIGIRKSFKSNYIMPYLYNGAAGLLNTLLIYRKKYYEPKYDIYIKQIVNGLKNSFFAKNASLFYGMSGIIYSLLNYRQSFDDKSIDSNSKRMINELQYYTFNLADNLYVISPKFDCVAVDFANGNEGVVKVLKDVKKDLNWKE